MCVKEIGQGLCRFYGRRLWGNVRNDDSLIILSISSLEMSYFITDMERVNRNNEGPK